MATSDKLDLAGDGFFRLVDLLEVANKEGFPAEVPAPVDHEFSQIARSYRTADPAVRQQVREQIPADYLLPLLGLGDRCAEWAMVDHDTQHLEDGLTAYCLEDFRGAPHENFVHLSMLWYAAKKLHADTGGLFNQVGRLGSHHGLQELSNFQARPDEAKSPFSMGLETYDDHGHTRFRPRKRKGANKQG